MSYGFKFYNDSSEIVIDDTHLKPWFVGKATVSSITGPITSSASTTPGYSRYTINYATPAGYNGFALCTLPANGFYAADARFYSGYNFEISALFPDGYTPTSSDSPEVYCFSLGTIGSPGGGFGAQVFNDIGQCIFDSTKRHIKPVLFPTINLPTVTAAGFAQPPSFGVDQVNSLGSLPTKPAFYLPRYLASYAVPLASTGQSAYLYEIRAYFKRSGTTLIASKKQTFRYTEDSRLSFYINDGNTDAQTMLVIDAARFDVGGTAPPPFPTATYALSKSAGTVEEGGAITITLTTTNLSNGTEVPWSISGSGITEADFTNGLLSGVFTVQTNSASVTLTPSSDGSQEGTETATLSLSNGAASISFGITDPSPIYALNTSPGAINEGESFTITLSTANVPNGTVVNYTLSGFDGSDFTNAQPGSGSFTVSNSAASRTFTAALDNRTDGNKTFRLTLFNGQFIDIPVYDTSLFPAAGTLLGTYCDGYNLYGTYADGSGGSYNSLIETNSASCGYVPPQPAYSISGPASINEGGSYTYNISTSNVGSGVQLSVAAAGVSASDVTVNGSPVTLNGSGAATFTVSVAADATTEGNETMYLRLFRNGSHVHESFPITINDTSQCPLAGTLLSTYCSGYNLYYRYANGSCGFQDELFEANSASCGYVPPLAPPTINFFNALPDTINQGGSANLAWEVTGTNVSVSINNGVGAVALSGSTSVAPSTTTTYTLTATNSSGTVTANRTIAVNVPPPLALQSVAFAPNPVYGGETHYYTVTLNRTHTGPVDLDFRLVQGAPYNLDNSFADLVTIPAGQLTGVHTAVMPTNVASHNATVYVSSNTAAGTVSTDIIVYARQQTGGSSFSVSNTNSATQNTFDFQIFAVMGQYIKVGTTNLTGSSLTSGDSYIRLFDPNGTEVASNDDYGSNASYLEYQVPYGITANYTVKVGAWSNGSAAGNVQWRVMNSSGGSGTSGGGTPIGGGGGGSTIEP